MSATAGLEQMRAQLDDGSAYAAAGIPADQRGLDFVRPDGTRTVFPAAERRAHPPLRRHGQAGARGVARARTRRSPGAGTYAFGSFRSPSWLTQDRAIPATPTRTGAPKVTGSEEVGFTLIVPSGAKPAGGWPVAIFGPGITRSKYDLFLAADRNAERGLATMAIDPVGHAYGARSEASVDTVVPPQTVRFSGFGRGRDLNGDGEITDQEGVRTPEQPHPLASIGLRDGLRQTALDNMALVRAVGRGVDVDGDGSEDLRRDGDRLLRAEPRRHLRHDADGRRPARARRRAERARRADPRHRAPVAGLPRAGRRRPEEPPARPAQRRPRRLHGVAAALPGPAGDQARPRRAWRSRTRSPRSTGSTARAAPSPSRRCCAARRSAAWGRRRSSTSSPSATRPSRTRPARR